MANERTDTKGKTVTVTLIRSTTGFKDNQEVVARGLGLRKLNSTVELKDTPELLREQGLVQRTKSLIKILARGDIGKKLTVRAHKFSGKASEKLQAAGGNAEVIA